ncbi:hypothetical protein [Novosphingobium huizhouense]|uniref:hypothetical protein n=1 Tax=Novosphingobium huizhouense TaxID=2866625 RepID=UPI001CD85363|nr:hypothetical protein [Novosphingobium huizhouense]
MTVEYDLPELLNGRVDSIAASLPEMGDGQLAALRELEAAGSARKTLLAAIDAETSGRKEAADKLAEPTGEPSEPTAAEVARDGAMQGEPEAPAPGTDLPGTFADAPMPEDAPGNPDVNDIATKVEQLRDALRFAGFEVDAGTDTIGTAAAALMGLIRPEAHVEAVAQGPAVLELSATADAGSAFTVVFGDAQGRRIEPLPALQFGAAAFADSLAGGERLLTRAIEFPVGVAGCAVSSVWLVDEAGAAWSRVDLLAPLPVGGGRSSAIPAGYLAFPVPPAALPLAA